MKKYTNLIVIGVILLAAAVFITIKTVNFNDVLLTLGYYDKKISLINTGDVHGHLVYDEANGGYYSLEEVNVEMGLPLIKGLVDDLRKKNPDSLLVDSGDMFHGTNEANIDEAQGVVEAANLMGYDAMALGNHDLDFGFDRAVEIKNQLKYPMLSANAQRDGKPAFEQYKIIEVGGKKIGVFGMTVPEALSNMNVFDQKGVQFEDPAEAATRVIKILHEQKVDAIVMLSHLGDDLDRELVKKVDGIDFILAGHHHFLYKEATKVNNTYIAEPGSYTTHVGLADLYFRNGKVAKVGWHIFQSNDRSKEDKAVLAVADKYHAIALERGKEVVGKTTVQLNGIRSQVRSKETNLADLITDAMRDIGKADLALLNGGGIRESVPKGEVTLYNVGKPLPFVNSLVTVEVPGQKVYDALERGLREWPNGSSNGGFLQVSGITYEFDGSKPAGKRLVSVSKDGQPLDKEKIYRVATNDYLVNGGDNYEEFKGAKQVYKGDLLRDVLAEYIKEKGEVAPATDGRIKILNERYK
ncbi:bifunctional metallophosphatase/5'-nucleotidase [Paenibacillus athensensis]|uniref:Multifunctional 2',3'-cyclic-nucleotide 2'-phosphodiesterase/5'-nucleotidase/3'-nucleotidase n=1 Tax=Paenibacillus athensensis TaxID=1967502 RepID=A0A4Y8Q2B6_9BACL|nr:bifunctional UDP-sugar hydrolase/5'-nucleotidase [Paenibacillus athensensis]MCD1258647.1 bifunctional metallophosphatase/5'-nucleotidase [Paenibacillus athensensis]